MEIEVVSVRKFTKREMELLSHTAHPNLSRRGLIRVLGAGVTASVVPSLILPSVFSAEAGALAKYFFRGLRVAKDIVPISEAVYHWAVLFNGGGDQNKRQEILVKLEARDGSAEDEASKMISIDPDEIKTVRAVSRAKEPGNKRIIWETDDDESSLRIRVTDL